MSKDQLPWQQSFVINCQDVLSRSEKPTGMGTHSQIRWSIPKMKFITQSVLFENEIRPGVLHLIVQQKCQL